MLVRLSPRGGELDATRGTEGIGHADTDGALLPRCARRRHGLCRRPDRVRLPERRAVASAPGSGLSLLRFAYPEAGALHPAESQLGAAGRRLRAEGRREVASVPHEPRRLLLLRPGV